MFYGIYHNDSNMPNQNGNFGNASTIMQNLQSLNSSSDMNSMFMKGFNNNQHQKPLKIAANNVASGKFTCRYDIQIEKVISLQR